MLRRFPDWPSRLEEFIAARKRVPFRWGRNDCCLFAADAIRCMTGQDLAAGYREEYRTRLGAARLISEQGSLADLAAWIASRYGLPEVPAARASRGDPVILEIEEKYGLGIVGLSGDSAWYLIKTGLHLAPLEFCTKAWKL